MAKDKKPRTPRNQSALANLLQTNMDRLYRTTHYMSPTPLRDLEDIKDKINQSISNIHSNNVSNTGEANISGLYSRLFNVQNDNDVLDELSKVFDDQSLMGDILTTYNQNRWIKELDEEIDTVLKYVTKLGEALDTKKENVLCSDHFSKNFINAYNKSRKNDEVFNNQIEELKDKYKLEELIDTSYDSASRYGEQFLYIVPYSRAIARLMSAKNGNAMAGIRLENASFITDNDGVIPLYESADIKDTIRDARLNVEISLSNVIESAVNETKIAINRMQTISESSMHTSFVNAINEAAKSDTDEKPIKVNDKLISDKLSFEGFDNDSAQDGLISNKFENITSNELKTSGCVVKKLDHSNVIPQYIEDLCLGYYYVEIANNSLVSEFRKPGGVMPMSSGNRVNSSQAKAQFEDNDALLRKISAKLSEYIDKKFINANKDVTKEIYMILKNNDILNNPSSQVRITFIPPEDIIHIYFNKDPMTNHGISDLYKALLPAKLYASLYITNALGQLTRGQDKRVYYVKQSIDTNIAETMLNTINQIKKGNFNIRQIENINNVLNVLGRFNDYVIPMNTSGDPPIQFEVMPGQQFDVKTDLMDMLEESAVNTTDVPIELIQARRSMDYAIEYSMSNSKFFKKVIARQASFQRYITRMITMIYNYEYERNDLIEITLPPPLFLSITNTNQIVTNANELATAITDMETSQDSDDPETITLFTRNLKRHFLGTYLPMATISSLLEKARIDAAKMKADNSENQPE